jgi:2,4-diketo-3-deoxy-L-fuconate hydrolase
MKLVRFGDLGRERPGILDEQGAIRDLSSIINDIAGAVLLPEGLARLASTDINSLPKAGSATRLGACVGHVGKLIGIGLNYSDHAAEVGRQAPSFPEFFLKATSSISGPADLIRLPRGSEHTDWEAELGVIIGEPGNYISEADALSHVAGYCTAGDISDRKYQAESGASHGKSFDTFGPLGPWLVTKDEVPNPHNLSVTCDVDGQRYQNGNTRNLIFKLPAAISFISRYFTLQTGDVIVTGTPGGVGKGQKPSPIYLRKGQKVRIEIGTLGVQEHEIA